MKMRLRGSKLREMKKEKDRLKKKKAKERLKKKAKERLKKKEWDRFILVLSLAQKLWSFVEVQHKI